MRADAELLVKTCHHRGAHALGGMAARIPNRRDPQVNEAALAGVREDKVRESGGAPRWLSTPVRSWTSGLPAGPSRRPVSGTA